MRKDRCVLCITVWIAVLMGIAHSAGAHAAEITQIYGRYNGAHPVDSYGPQIIELDIYDNLYLTDYEGDLRRISADGRMEPIVSLLDSLPWLHEVSIRWLAVDTNQRVYLGGRFFARESWQEGVFKVEPGGVASLFIDFENGPIRGTYSLEDVGLRDMAIVGDDRLTMIGDESGRVWQLLPDGTPAVRFDPELNGEIIIGTAREGFFPIKIVRSQELSTANNLLLEGQNNKAVIVGFGKSLMAEKALLEITSQGAQILPLFQGDHSGKQFSSGSAPIVDSVGDIYAMRDSNVEIDERNQSQGFSSLWERLFFNRSWDLAEAFKWGRPGVVSTLIDPFVAGAGAIESRRETLNSAFFNETTYYYSKGTVLIGVYSTALDGAGNFYIAGVQSHNVFVVLRDGSIIELMDRNGDSQGNQLNYPQDIEVDSQGNVYVLGSSAAALENTNAKIFKILSPVDAIESSLPTDIVATNSLFAIGESAPMVRGGLQDDLVSGTSETEIYQGGDGNDRLILSSGVDHIFGGNGTDTAVLEFDYNDYVSSKDPVNGTVEITSKSGHPEALVATDVEFLEFRDQVLAVADLSYLGTLSPVTADSNDAVYRFFNSRDMAFFYTSSLEEAQNVLDRSAVTNNNLDEWPYAYQGSSFAPAHSYTDSQPLHRFYNWQTGHHFFTADPDEVAAVNDAIVQRGWTFNYEGIAFDVYLTDPNPESTGEETPVFRFYSEVLNRHFFTGNILEAFTMNQTGIWSYEGIGFYGERL